MFRTIAWICCFAAVLLMSGVSRMAAAQVDPPEVRAVYVASFDLNTQAKCDAIIANILSRPINQVYVQVRSRGDAYYYPNRTSSVYPNNEPRSQTYAISPSDLDVLQYFIDAMHNATPRREVHAWLTTYNSWNRVALPVSPNHVRNLHPEWITTNAAGVPYDTAAEDCPLDQGIPEVQDWIANVFLDVVRNYDVDGIHFDYVRMINANAGFNPLAKARFLAETGWNIDTQNPAGELDRVYRHWRRDQIARLVQRVHTYTMLERPWVETSAFLINFTDSVENLAQGYNWWVAHNAIDVLHTSVYSSSISGSVSNYNFFVSKLTQNGDQFKRPQVAAVGDYLLVDPPGENADCVVTLRGNARTPDGFNFFDYGSLFVDGPTRTPPQPADQHAQNLFNPGGPMPNWAPVPVITHKIPMGEESVPPNPPASLNAVVLGGDPQITFNRPAAAGDGDLPVRYQLYRDTQTPVRLTYARMVMEWWDPGSPRTSFTFDDVSAPAGNLYYAAVAYDDWNNRAVATVGPVAVASGGDHIVETRTGGLNVANYSEFGTFYDSSSHSTAAGLTASIGSRFARPADGNGKNDRARFTPTGIAAGNYDVFVTCFNFSSANAPGITVRINDSLGVRTSAQSPFNLTMANCGNKWTLCAQIQFVPGQGHYVEFDNTTQTNNGADDRMNAAAVLFVRTDSTPFEEKPLVSEPPSTVTEVIVDSHPRALNYDNITSTGHWSESTLSGYYNSNAYFYSNANYPVKSYAAWVVDLPRAGKWAIDGWVRNNTAFAQQAQYRFVDGTGTVRNTVASQRTAFDSTTTGGWFIDVDGVTDGSAFTFNKGRVYVTLYGNLAGSQTLIADALRFRLIEESSVGEWELYD